eukprot:3085822-Prymnesium_polylepis.1
MSATSPAVSTHKRSRRGSRRQAAGARPCYHLLPPGTKRERGAQPAAPLRRPRRSGIRRQALGMVHRRLPEAS